MNRKYRERKTGKETRQTKENISLFHRAFRFTKFYLYQRMH